MRCPRLPLSPQALPTGENSQQTILWGPEVAKSARGWSKFLEIRNEELMGTPDVTPKSPGILQSCAWYSRRMNLVMMSVTMAPKTSKHTKSGTPLDLFCKLYEEQTHPNSYPLAGDSAIKDLSAGGGWLQIVAGLHLGVVLPTFLWSRNLRVLVDGLSGPLNRLNALLSLLHPLDRYRTPSAIGSAIGRRYLALSRIQTQVGVLDGLVLNRLAGSTAR